MGLLPSIPAALPIYISAAFCVLFVGSFFAATYFLGGILSELRRGAFRGYRVQIVKADKNEKQ